MRTVFEIIESIKPEDTYVEVSAEEYEHFVISASRSDVLSMPRPPEKRKVTEVSRGLFFSSYRTEVEYDWQDPGYLARLNAWRNKSSSGNFYFETQYGSLPVKIKE